MKRIGIITSGGDCGGLNGVVKGAAQMATRRGIQAFAIPNGYAGLYNLIDMASLVELTPSRMDTFSIGLAGSEAGHSRVKIRKIEDPNKWQRIKDGLKKFQIDGLIISGGDDTGSVIVDLDANGIKCVHAPKTMDLDLQPYSVGGDSTINRISEMVQHLKTTGRSHNRVIILEVFGRYAGHTAFRGGVAGEADAILIPEVPVDFNELYRHCSKVFTRRVMESDVNAGTYLIVAAEGMRNESGEELYDESTPPDAFGHRKLAGAGKYVAQKLKTMLKEDDMIREFMRAEGLFVEGLYETPEVRVITPTHLVRSGFTSAYDANFGMEAGAGALCVLVDGLSGVTVTGYLNGKVHYMPIAEAIKQRHVDLDKIILFEQLGYCFGRVRQEFKPGHQEVSGKIERIY